MHVRMCPAATEGCPPAPAQIGGGAVIRVCLAERLGDAHAQQKTKYTHTGVGPRSACMVGRRV